MEKYLKITITEEKIRNLNIGNTYLIEGIEYPVCEVDIDMQRLDYLYISKYIKCINISCPGPLELEVDEENPWFIYKHDGALIRKEEDGSLHFFKYIEKEGKEKYQVPSGIKTISSKAFWNCQTLKKLYLNDELEHIAYNGIKQCFNLKEVVLTENSRLKEIAIDVFKIYLPPSVEHIGTDYNHCEHKFICLDDEVHGNQKGTIFHRRMKKILYYGKHEKKLIIPYGIEIIDDKIRFAHANEIYIPETIKFLGVSLKSLLVKKIYIDLPSAYFYEKVLQEEDKWNSGVELIFNEPEEIFVNQGKSQDEIEDIRQKFSIYDNAKWEYSVKESVYSVFEFDD